MNDNNKFSFVAEITLKHASLKPTGEKTLPFKLAEKYLPYVASNYRIGDWEIRNIEMLYEALHVRVDKDKNPFSLNLFKEKGWHEKARCVVLQFCEIIAQKKYIFDLWIVAMKKYDRENPIPYKSDLLDQLHIAKFTNRPLQLTSTQWSRGQYYKEDELVTINDPKNVGPFHDKAEPKSIFGKIRKKLIGY